jgi:hypothetical protein
MTSVDFRAAPRDARAFTSRILATAQKALTDLPELRVNLL